MFEDGVGGGPERGDALDPTHALGDPAAVRAALVRRGPEVVLLADEVVAAARVLADAIGALSADIGAERTRVLGRTLRPGTFRTASPTS